jgi:uncharacterized protein (TIGR02452 family)
MPSSSKSAKVRPSEVAADTKRHFIPLVNSEYGQHFPPFSTLYASPLRDLPIQPTTLSTRPPTFIIETGDPVERAIAYSNTFTTNMASESATPSRIRVPFICAANDRRPGGDWETGCSGYEETLCRRSNLSATLAQPWDQDAGSNYPIPSGGGIYSDAVVVCRGPHDRYQKLPTWYDLPVVSVPPTRWPKLKENGTKYSFAQERDMIRDKIRGALRICLYNGYQSVVIGDFGLGNGHRNPPREMAEIWRDVFLFDPVLRGQFHYVVFAFDDPYQSTSALILSEIDKQIAREQAKQKKSSSRSGSHRGEPSSSSVRGGSSSAMTDLAIFERVFSQDEIDRVLGQRDPRYDLDMITT